MGIGDNGWGAPGGPTFGPDGLLSLSRLHGYATAQRRLRIGG